MDLDLHLDAWREREDTLLRTPGSLPEGAVQLDLADGLELAEGLLVALALNPSLRLERARVGVAADAEQHAGTWLDPELALGALRIQENVPERWVIAPELTFTIPLGGTRHAAQEVARAEHAVARDRVAEVQWHLWRDVRLAWARWSALEEREAVITDLLAVLEDLAQRTQELAQVGELSTSEASLFSIEHHTRLQELRELGAHQARAETELRGLLGLRPQAQLRWVPVDLRVVANLEGSAPEESHPTVRRLLSEYQRAEQQLEAEIRGQWPDLTLGPAYEFDAGSDRLGLIAGLALPLWNRNVAGIARARAQREVARVGLLTGFETLRSAWSGADAELAVWVSARESLETELQPRVDEQVLAARRLVELGEGSSLVWLESLRALIDVRLRAIELDLAIAVGRIERAALAGPQRSER
ncbi:MAG: TolC family protein [Planctomycetota bacterium]|nr:TolC family protein [Planctomycetota bacterium]